MISIRKPNILCLLFNSIFRIFKKKKGWCSLNCFLQQYCQIDQHFQFHVSISSNLVFSFIIYFFLLYYPLKIGNKDFFGHLFFYGFSTQFPDITSKVFTLYSTKVLSQENLKFVDPIFIQPYTKKLLNFEPMILVLLVNALIQLTFIKPIPREPIIEWPSYQCKIIFKAIMNFLVFWPYTLIISNFFPLPLSKLIKNKVP